MKSESHPAAIPFSITPEAEDYLRSRLHAMPTEARVVLKMTLSQTDGLSPPRWRYEGQSFVLGYFDTKEQSELDNTETELLGRCVAIESSAWRQLAGKTLGLRRVAASHGLIKISRYVLVADSTPEPNSSGLPAGVSPEQRKRALSIAALSILGGFTGMGVVWVVPALVFSMLGIAIEKLLPVMPLLFAVGWVAGAIISFGFFKSVFKTEGRTRFAQEQKQRRYVGYGGLEAKIDWWIFLGIPVPLTVILIFATEPFARTVGEKTGIVFGAIVLIFTPTMYFCDRLPRRLVFRLGIVGWVVTFVLGFWYFKTHGP